MFMQGMQGRFKIFRNFLLIYLLSVPATLYASFIESTIGTAVVNDATATYYNPAALIVLKNPQIITLGSKAYFRSQFTGQAVQTETGEILSGSSTATTHYFLPSFYFGIPATDKVSLGLAVITNFFNREAEENSILRYQQSSNNIQDVDLTLGAGYKFNEYFSVGAGLNISQADFLLKPIIGFPRLNIPDAESRNESSATGVGGDVGFLLKPSTSTLVGFNYRTGITYQLSGKSVFEGEPRVISDNYHFKFWTPARSVISINQFLTSKLGVIGTVHYIEWDVFNRVKIHNIATPLGIIPVANVPYHLHNSWIFTVGSHYQVTEKLIARVAGSYSQSPSSGKFQISNGDSIIIGASVGYKFNKYVDLDGSYAHAFMKDQSIHIIKALNTINGVNKGYRDAISLKLTINII